MSEWEALRLAKCRWSPALSQRLSEGRETLAKWLL